MSSTKTLIALAVLAALVVGAAGTAFAADGDGASPAENRTITVAGSGDVDVAPDAAIVRLSVEASGTDAGNVSDTLATKAERLRERLQEFGVDASAIQTRHYDVRTDRPERDREGEEHYVGQQSLEVTLSDVDRAGDLIDAAVEGGADEIHGVEFTLSADERDEVRDQALRAALENARDEASVLATASALDVSGIQSISTRGTDLRPYRAEAVAYSGGDGGASTRIDSRDVTVSASVQVVFTAEPA
jgi:uncharacterized protein YggE